MESTWRPWRVAATATPPWKRASSWQTWGLRADRNSPAPSARCISANITPHLETGIGKWDEAFFLKKFADYKDYAANGTPPMTGPEQFTLMPWLDFSDMQPEDLGAIYTFLRTVKPVDHHVEIHPSPAR